MRRVAWTLVAGATFLASGSLVSACAPIYIPGGQLPTVEPLRLESADRPTGTLRLSSRLFREPIERATRESGVFKAFAIEPGESRTPWTDYAVTIEVRARPRRPTVGHVAYTLTAAMTLGVLPLTRQVDLRLTATLANRTGQVLKVYTFEDSIREVQQVAIMFLPIGVVLSPDRAATRVVENMMRHLYWQLEAEHLLLPVSPSSRASSAATGRVSPSGAGSERTGES